jgi:hypothetical protein
VGYDRDLNKALEILKTETRAFLAETQGIAPEKTEEWMATRYDCRIAEVVNKMKGVFCMIPKKGVKLKRAGRHRRLQEVRVLPRSQEPLDRLGKVKGQRR